MRDQKTETFQFISPNSLSIPQIISTALKNCVCLEGYPSNWREDTMWACTRPGCQSTLLNYLSTVFLPSRSTSDSPRSWQDVQALCDPALPSSAPCVLLSRLKHSERRSYEYSCQDSRPGLPRQVPTERHSTPRVCHCGSTGAARFPYVSYF